MNCPKCSSENTQTFEMAFSHGASDIAGTSVSGGYLGGRIGGTVSKHSGVQLSVLAQKTAPPKEKSYKWFIGLIVFGVIVLAQKGWIMGAIFLLAGLGGGYFAYDFNKNKYPALFIQWKQRWVCLKCGHDFSE